MTNGIGNGINDGIGNGDPNSPSPYPLLPVGLTHPCNVRKGFPQAVMVWALRADIRRWSAMTNVIHQTKAESLDVEFPNLPGAHCSIRGDGEPLYDPELWFPPIGGGNSLFTEYAKAICDSGCPVKDECLAWALEHDEKGVWGGRTEKERERIRAGLPLSQMRVCKRCEMEFPIPSGTRGAPPSYCSRECKKAAA